MQCVIAAVPIRRVSNTQTCQTDVRSSVDTSCLFQVVCGWAGFALVTPGLVPRPVNIRHLVLKGKCLTVTLWEVLFCTHHALAGAHARQHSQRSAERKISHSVFVAGLALPWSRLGWCPCLPALPPSAERKILYSSSDAGLALLSSFHKSFTLFRIFL